VYVFSVCTRNLFGVCLFSPKGDSCVATGFSPWKAVAENGRAPAGGGRMIRRRRRGRRRGRFATLPAVNPARSTPLLPTLNRYLAEARGHNRRRLVRRRLPGAGWAKKTPKHGHFEHHKQHTCPPKTLQRRRARVVVRSREPQFCVARAQCSPRPEGRAANANKEAPGSRITSKASGPPKYFLTFSAATHTPTHGNAPRAWHAPGPGEPCLLAVTSSCDGWPAFVSYVCAC